MHRIHPIDPLRRRALDCSIVVRRSCVYNLSLSWSSSPPGQISLTRTNQSTSSGPPHPPPPLLLLNCLRQVFRLKGNFTNVFFAI
ncbi:hypothetical protein ANCDUO_12965 [Ancylostoma duodenale]|uniref:Uncharacterized protein n=1 Tax=Ancylostoma duodenale TaxID=51022 RepID=A0A0C2GIG2_9BILA|nr:hypothetical protein ANCDUO_12965 [Ancylostoma duodenale]